MRWAPVDTLSDSLAQLEGEAFGDKLALVLDKAVVNKLSDSLTEVIVKKFGDTGSKRKAEGFLEKNQDRPNIRSRHLVTHSQR